MRLDHTKLYTFLFNVIELINLGGIFSLLLSLQHFTIWRGSPWGS